MSFFSKKDKKEYETYIYIVRYATPEQIYRKREIPYDLMMKRKQRQNRAITTPTIVDSNPSTEIKIDFFFVILGKSSDE